MVDMDFSTLDWVLLLLGAALVGISKGGFPGVAMLSVGIYASVMPPKQASAILLILLTIANMVSAVIYFKDVDWRSTFKFLPSSLIGVFMGYLTLLYTNSDALLRHLTGWIILLITIFNFLREAWLKHPKGREYMMVMPRKWWFAATFGLVGGWTTLVANAAGPAATLFLMARGLDKITFIATIVWIFLIVNMVKIPFQVALGNINLTMLPLALWLTVVSIIFTLITPFFVKRVPTAVFNAIIWILVILSGIKLIVT